MNDTSDLRHGGMGIASFCIALFVIVGFFVAVGAAGALHVARDASPTLSTVVGFAIFGFAVLDLVGIGLGIAGLFDRRSKKVFPILGVVIGLGGLLLVAALIGLGLSMK